MPKSSNVQVTRKQGETAGSLLRRFTQHVREGGLLTQVRANQYFSKKRSRISLRDSALVKEKRREEYSRMRKLGVSIKKK